MDQSTGSKYRDYVYKELPQHCVDDDFSIRHPKMKLSQRAKIFSPFAALRGFDEAIESKLETYVSKSELTDEDQERINRVLQELVELAGNSREAREHPVSVTVTFYVPCQDENHEAYGLRGQYQTVTGMLRKIDPLILRALQVDETVIEFSDILEIRIEPQSGEDF